MQLFLDYKLLDERDPVEYLDRVRQGTAVWSVAHPKRPNVTSKTK